MNSEKQKMILINSCFHKLPFVMKVLRSPANPKLNNFAEEHYQTCYNHLISGTITLAIRSWSSSLILTSMLT